MPEIEIKILQPHEINVPGKKPKIEHGAKVEDYHAGQELMGGVLDRPPEIFPNEDCSALLVNFRYQRNGNFDDWSCVTHALIHGYSLLANYISGWVKVLSIRRVSVSSGTKPQQGNSVNAPLEWFRHNGTEAESTCPTLTPTMTEDEFFNLGAMNPKNEVFLSEGFLPLHEWVKNPLIAQCSLDEVGKASKRGPVMISVDGEYHFNQYGQLDLLGQAPHYDHEVLYVKSVRDDQGKLLYALVADSENPPTIKEDGTVVINLLPISPYYLPGFAKNIYLSNSKKKLMFRLAKTISSPAVFLLCEASMTRLGIADSPGVGMTGGQMLKTMSGTYGNAGIQIVTDEEMAKYAYSEDIKASPKSNS